MCDGDDDDDGDGDFWKELASDIANGLNDENEDSNGDGSGDGEDDSCESESDSESSLLRKNAANFESAVATKPTNNTKPKKCDDSTSHYHCYCLHSKTFKHRFKNYIGFTTNPERRLKQHNGIIKGGAWKTKRGGRPWEFVVLVTGFPTHKMALQFEWAWQHPGRSLLVRAVIGDAPAKTLQRKRATKGQMCILKTLLELCPDLYEGNALTLNFLSREFRALYESAVPMPALPSDVIAVNLLSIREGGKKRRIESAMLEGLPPPSEAPAVSIRVIENLTEMPFWATRKQKPSKVKRKPEPIHKDAEGGEIVEDATADRTKESQNGIGDLYRRCCDSELLEDTSSSEDERQNRNDKHARRIGFGEDIDSDDTDDDDNFFSHLTPAIKDTRMATSSSDSSSSSEDSDVDNFIDNAKYEMRTDSEVKDRWGKVNSAPTAITNVISIDDNSSDDSFDGFLSSPSPEKVASESTKTRTQPLEERIDALMIDRKEHRGEDSESNDSSKNKAFVPSFSLEEKLDAMMVVEGPNYDAKIRGPFSFNGVTTRRPKKNPTTRSSDVSGRGESSSINEALIVCVDGDDEHDGDRSMSEGNPGWPSSLSPSSMVDSVDTKRMSIVDLCTP